MRYVEVGNTEIVCQKISELITADTFKIEMKNPYAKPYLWESGGIIASPEDFADFGLCSKCRGKSV